ncbi:MAG TPA: Hsp20/alpha crystallin family protein [Atopostipes sp.]|nr:Hsp20/alpha crystallin family protein [Atopostipes sp.]
MNDMFPSRRDFMNFGGRFFDDLFGQSLATATSFNTDIKETDKEYIVVAEIPGIPKENIEVDYQNNVLSIMAKYEQDTEETNKEFNYIRRERSSRSYNRQFIIQDIDEDSITAKFENGLLTVQLPKKDPEKSATKKIEIE